MLTEWTIGNFKSIADPTTMSLANPNVICGANSSGKSSIMQSVLLIGQTLASPARNRPLILNGELVRLGYFDDLLHNGSTEKPLRIGFKHVADQASEGISEVTAEWSLLSRPNDSKRQMKLQTSSLRKSQVVVRLLAEPLDLHHKFDADAELRERLQQGEFNYRLVSQESHKPDRPRQAYLLSNNPDVRTHLLTRHPSESGC
jgi:predicted ATPase